MSNLNNLDLNNIQKFVKADFDKAFSQQVTNYQAFTKEIMSSDKLISFEWIGALPKMRKWVGSRYYNQMKKYDYSFKTDSYEGTILIPYSDILNASKTELSKMAKGQVAGYGAQVKLDYPSDLVYEALGNGTVNLCYDGQPFFANAHPTYYGATTFDNLLVGSGVSAANLKTDIATAILTLATMIDEENRKLNLKLGTIVCHPLLALTFAEVLASVANTGSPVNVLSGLGIKVISDARLTDQNDWYAMATSPMIKPIIHAQVGNIEVRTKDDTFNTKSIVIGVDVEGGVGYGYPQTALKFVNV